MAFLRVGASPNKTKEAAIKPTANANTLGPEYKVHLN